MIAPPAHSTHSNDDSDSDWDDDDDFGAKKINIKIKPIAQVTPSKISASVDELRATVGTWKSLANINLVKPNSRRHHQSTVQLNNVEGQDQQATTLAPSTISSAILPETMILSNNHNNDHHRHTINSNGISNNGNQMLDLYDMSLTQQVTRDLEKFVGLQPVSNGILRPSSSAILSPGFQSAFSRISIDNDTVKLPVAFAIQECLNANLFKGSSKGGSWANLIGRVKMAVPPKIYNMNSSSLEQKLDITLESSIPWDKIRLNSEFVCEIDDRDRAQPFVTSNTTKRLSIDMKAIQAYIQKQYQKQPNTKYFILPELLKYAIGSQDKHELSDISAPLRVNPLHALSHWLCDLTITKVRVDIQSLENTLSDLGLSTDDIKNLKISMHVSGGVVSYQSKPEANWNPLNSKLTWSFTDLSELVQKSTLSGVTSCLARFDLNDGPSTPSDVSLQFSIAAKTISGSHFILNDTTNFRLATQKYEVRTGTFICEPPCH